MLSILLFHLIVQEVELLLISDIGILPHMYEDNRRELQKQDSPCVHLLLPNNPFAYIHFSWVDEY